MLPDLAALSLQADLMEVPQAETMLGRHSVAAPPRITFKGTHGLPSAPSARPRPIPQPSDLLSYRTRGVYLRSVRFQPECSA